ncbi:hypothetical protein BDA99DRAFT_521359 [Phascolomyces articulosus]|uniref:Uncharacterized protein n=1 Tax=Phascolomyces articulosus TaxID=60185 RepID=A0AAD5K2G5_9FUNG|nr:hypothetical protein BDA99DRAFT_521359 [Phascolomyces articulosus]
MEKNKMKLFFLYTNWIMYYDVQSFSFFYYIILFLLTANLNMLHNNNKNPVNSLKCTLELIYISYPKIFGYSLFGNKKVKLFCVSFFFFFFITTSKHTHYIIFLYQNQNNNKDFFFI